MKTHQKALVLVLIMTMTFLAGCQQSQTHGDTYFSDWPQGQSPDNVGKQVVEYMLPRWQITEPSRHYAEDSCWVYALKFAAMTGDDELKEALIRRFDPFLEEDGMNLVSMQRHVDYTIFGIVPLELYMQTKDETYLKIGKMLADRQWERPRDNGLSGETRFWIDDMYMITILQVQAFRATGDSVYLDRAALEMEAYLDRLQRDNGLFYHGPGFPFFWGRGNGWVAGGMTELLLELPEDYPRYDRVMKGYLKMMAALLKFQGEDGMWHQLIDHPESYKETSSTAMFTYAMITGAKQGWLTDPAHAEAARKGWLALQSYIDQEGAISNVCEGTGQRNDINYYLTRPRHTGDPHGQAPLMWCAVSLLR
jgi:rhamnogalacturonyl hydrolase YesR